MKQANRQYTDEFKKEAVKLALNSISTKKAARDLGIPDATLATWVLKAKRSGELPLPSGQQINVASLIDENKLLKKRLTRLEEEKAILKKAATYFAKELG
jgi:transposase|tara:strand:+ start:197 stop:496 length:300 start_codon:yes stop_codon:yes gene_type:complete